MLFFLACGAVLGAVGGMFATVVFFAWPWIEEHMGWGQWRR